MNLQDTWRCLQQAELCEDDAELSFLEGITQLMLVRLPGVFMKRSCPKIISVCIPGPSCLDVLAGLPYTTWGRRDLHWTHIGWSRYIVIYWNIYQHHGRMLYSPLFSMFLPSTLFRGAGRSMQTLEAEPPQIRHRTDPEALDLDPGST